MVEATRQESPRQLSQAESIGQARVPVALQYNLGSRVVSIVSLDNDLNLQRDSAMISEAIHPSRIAPNC